MQKIVIRSLWRPTNLIQHTLSQHCLIIIPPFHQPPFCQSNPSTPKLHHAIPYHSTITILLYHSIISILRTSTTTYKWLFTTSSHHFISPLHLTTSSHHFISPLHLTTSSHHFISPLHLTTSSHHFISPLHLTTSFHHFISPPPLTTSSHHFISPPHYLSLTSLLTISLPHISIPPPHTSTPPVLGKRRTEKGESARSCKIASYFISVLGVVVGLVVVVVVLVLHQRDVEQRGL